MTKTKNPKNKKSNIAIHKNKDGCKNNEIMTWHKNRWTRKTQDQSKKSEWSEENKILWEEPKWKIQQSQPQNQEIKSSKIDDEEKSQKNVKIFDELKVLCELDNLLSSDKQTKEFGLSTFSLQYDTWIMQGCITDKQGV